jgi:hypothetical protein
VGDNLDAVFTGRKLRFLVEKDVSFFSLEILNGAGQLVVLTQFLNDLFRLIPNQGDYREICVVSLVFARD